MITRTADGYALNHWEGRPVKLSNGLKITAGEARAALCRKNGLSQKQSADELHCGVPNVRQYWQSLYYKLHTSDVVVALDKLVEMGALIHLCFIPLLLTVVFFANALSDHDNDIARRVRTRRGRDYAVLEEASDLPDLLDMDFNNLNAQLTA